MADYFQEGLKIITTDEHYNFKITEYPELHYSYASYYDADVDADSQKKIYRGAIIRKLEEEDAKKYMDDNNLYEEDKKLLVQNMFEHTYSCFFCLPIYTDIVAYSNGIYLKNEKFGNGPETTNELIHKYIKNGGFTGFDPINMNYSENTLMYIATCRGIIKGIKEAGVFFDECPEDIIIKNVIAEYVECIDQLNSNVSDEFLVNSLNYLKFTPDYKKIPYNSMLTGANAMIRCQALIMFTRDKETLLKYAIELSRLTHNSATGILSTVMALFLSYFTRYRDVNLFSEVKKYIHATEMYIRNKYPEILEQYNKDKHILIGKFEKYISARYISAELVDMGKSFDSPVGRIKYFAENYSSSKNNGINGARFFPGADAYDTLIISIDAYKSSINLEQTMFYTALTAGASHNFGFLANSFSASAAVTDSIDSNYYMDFFIRGEINYNVTRLFLSFSFIAALSFDITRLQLRGLISSIIDWEKNFKG